MKKTIKVLAVAALGLGALAPSVFAEDDSGEGGGPDNAPLDQVIADDLIVEGRICSSDANECIDGEDFLSFGPTGFQLEAKMKDNSPAIGFDTTGAGDADWVIGSNGNDDLRFEYDEEPGNSAADSGLVMSMRVPGLVGINELNPSAPLHVVGDDAVVDSTETVVLVESAVSPQQIFENTATGAEWFLAMTAAGQFKISRNGTGRVEARFFDNGDLKLAGTLIQGSDVANKADFESVDASSILDTITELPIAEWNYIGDDARHVGPTAQDFAAAFGLGNTDTGIAAIDADGVALAAIQALAAENDELRARVDAMTDSSGGGSSWMLLVGVALSAAAAMFAINGRTERGRRRQVAAV